MIEFWIAASMQDPTLRCYDYFNASRGLSLYTDQLQFVLDEIDSFKHKLWR